MMLMPAVFSLVWSGHNTWCSKEPVGAVFKDAVSLVSSIWLYAILEDAGLPYQEACGCGNEGRGLESMVMIGWWLD